MEPVEQTLAFERRLDGFDGALQPGVLLLSPVERDERLFGQRRDPCSQIGLVVEHLALGLLLKERLCDFGPPRLRLGLHDPSKAVAAGPKPPFDHRRPEPGRDLEPDRRDHGQLVLADLVVRRRFGVARGPTHGLQELERDAGLLAELSERRRDVPVEPIEGPGSEEVERKCAGLHGLRHAVERDPRPLEGADPSGLADIARDEATRGVRPHQSELDQPVDVLDPDPCPASQLLTRSFAHVGMLAPMRRHPGHGAGVRTSTGIVRLVLSSYAAKAGFAVVIIFQSRERSSSSATRALTANDSVPTSTVASGFA